MKTVSLIFLFSVAVSMAFANINQVSVTIQIEPFAKDDRVLILAPHPDDETIGCAGVIQRALKAGSQVKVMYLTNGDHNEFAFLVYEKMPIVFNREFVAMGKIREQEAKKAMKFLGLNESALIFLGYPDYGTDKMFLSFWDSKRPFSDLLTRQPYVPYKESPSYGSPYKPENLLKDIKRVLLDYKPNKIFVSHSADVNGDHWAYYCYLQIALRDLKQVIPNPKVYVYLVHAPGWPLPRHLHKNLKLYPYEHHFPEDLVNWSKLELTQSEVDKKYQAMLFYRSQTCVSAFYLLSFVRQNELFGDYPLVILKKQIFSGTKDSAGIFKDDNKMSYCLVNDELWIRVRKPQELKCRLILDFYILGYSEKTPFSKMPNIWVRVKHDNLKIREMNKAREVDPQDTTTEFSREYSILKIPLSILGNPDFLLACVETQSRFLSLEDMGFRKMEIED